jgi:hypothetical protein
MWQEDQRKYYKRKDKCLTETRINILNSTKGWLWEELDTWSLQLENWKKQYNNLGRLPQQKAPDLCERNAASWQTAQREKYKKKKKCMTDERIKILESTPGWKWSR